MKKSILITFLGFALTHLNFTNKLVFKLGTGLIVSTQLKSQNIIPYLDVTNHTYNWIISNSPGNTPQTAIVLTRMSYDSIFFRQKYFVFDTLNLVPSTTIDGKLLWIKPNGLAAVTSFSSISFPYSQLTGTPNIPSGQINSDWNSNSGVNQILNKPTTISGYSITDAQSKLNGTGFVKASGTTISYDNNTYLTIESDPTVPSNVKTISSSDITNWNNKLSSYTETDPIWISSPSFTITNTQTSNWNTAFGWGNHASAGYLTASSSNNLTNKTGNISQWTNNVGYLTSVTPQTLSLSGQTISLSGANSIVIPTQTTALTSAQVTTALGATPLFSEVDGSTSNELQTLSLSGQSISISSGNTIVIPTQTTAVTISSSNTLITVSGSHPNFTIGSPLIADYTNTVSTTGGVATFYLTSDKTATGTALYSNVTYVNPVVNDVTTNYIYGWTLSGDKKTLTISAKNSSLVTILSISVVAAPTNVVNGTIVSVLVKGN